MEDVGEEGFLVLEIGEKPCEKQYDAAKRPEQIYSVDKESECENCDRRDHNSADDRFIYWPRSVRIKNFSKG